jgi:hypothetical protein
MAGDSYAGITVPEGSAGGVESLGTTFDGMAGTLSGAAARLRGMPAQLNGWSGPGSVSFAGTAFEQADIAERAAQAFTDAGQAARTYARELREAKRLTREAITEARDANRRIKEAERELADAKDRLAAAETRAAAAAWELTVASVSLEPVSTAGAEAELRAATVAADQARDDITRAETKLEHAQDDLREAKRKGTKAAGEASDAAARLQMAYAHVSMMAPAVRMLAPPASATPGGGSRPFMPATLEVPLLSPSFGMAVVNGALTGSAAALLWKQWAHLDKRYHSYSPWKTIAATPRQRITVRLQELRAGRMLDTARANRLNPVKTIGGSAVVLEPVGAYFQWKDNEAAGVNPTENAIRTGMASGGSIGGAALAGAFCAATGVGTLVAAGCGIAGGTFGGWAGNAFGAVVYDVGKPIVEAAKDPGGTVKDFITDIGKGLVPRPFP